MAKGINMVGKFRGKVGAMVFRTEAGIGQIASEYNPNPKNPRTLAQTRQRVKMSLAGMISKNIPANLLVGLDSNGRTARSMFVSNILKSATLEAGATAGSFKAVLDMEKIKFSMGALVNVIVTGQSIDGEEITFTKLSAPEGVNMAGVRIIALTSQNGEYNGLHVKDVTFTNNESAGAVTMSIPELDRTIGGNVAMYFIPLVMVDGGTGVSFSKLLEMMKNTNDDLQMSAIVDTWVASQRGYVESYLFSEW